MTFSIFGLSVLLLASSADITAEMMANRIESVVNSVERLEVAGTISSGPVSISLTSADIDATAWKTLADQSISWNFSAPFVLERDFTLRKVYYQFNIDGKDGTAKQYHYNKERCTQIMRSPVLPTALIQKDVFKECLDESNPTRWDMIWLRPLGGASVADVLRQIVNEPGSKDPAEAPFRVNSITGEPGDRIVDMSLMYSKKALNKSDSNVYGLYVYRVLLAEKHDYMPLIVCELSQYLRKVEYLNDLDGEPISVFVYSEYKNVDGVPVPHVLTGYVTQRELPHIAVQLRLESASLNERANVRDAIEIPEGADVVDYMLETSYRQGEQAPLIDKLTEEALSDVERLQGEASSQGQQSATAGLAVGGGIVLGLLVLAGIALTRK